MSRLVAVRIVPLCLVALSLTIAQGLRGWLGPLDAWAEASLPVLCPLRFATGLPCPTCGLGRALLAAWSGSLAQALQHHFAGPLALFCALVGSTTWALHPTAAARGLRVLARQPAIHPRLAALAVAMYVAWGALRHWV